MFLENIWRLYYLIFGHKTIKYHDVNDYNKNEKPYTTVDSNIKISINQIKICCTFLFPIESPFQSVCLSINLIKYNYNYFNIKYNFFNMVI